MKWTKEQVIQLALGLVLTTSLLLVTAMFLLTGIIGALFVGGVITAIASIITVIVWADMT